MTKQPSKILLVGGNDHDPDLAAVAARLRDGGLEVVYLGALPGDAAVLEDQALQEDARLIVGVGVRLPALAGAATLCVTPDIALDAVRAALEAGA